jgi:type IV secretory pathway component VirB8
MFGKGKGKVDRTSASADNAALEAAPKRPRDVFDEGLSWESERMAQIAQSETRAWGVVKLMGLVVALSWAGIVLMMPLKESVPYVLKQAADGTVTTLTRVNLKEMTIDEAVVKADAARYVAARERYNWYILQDDYDLIMLLSSPDTAKEYSAIYEGSESRDKTLGNRVRVKIKILSVVPTGNEAVTVRYQLEKGSYDGTGKPTTESLVATLGYEYGAIDTLPEDKRWLNPYGFRVIAYRRDSEQFQGAR